jgi:hypothetical protein
MRVGGKQVPTMNPICRPVNINILATFASSAATICCHLKTHLHLVAVLRHYIYIYKAWFNCQRTRHGSTVSE